MRIGIDIRTLDGGAGYRGIGRFSVSLINAISRLDHDNTYFFVSAAPHETKNFFHFDKNFRYHWITEQQTVLRNIKYIRAAYVLPKALSIDKFKVDVFLHLDPLHRIKHGNTPVVSVIYDIIPFLYRDIYQQKKPNGISLKHLHGYARVRQFWNLFEKSIRNYSSSKKIISISQHTKKDLLRFEKNIQDKNVISIPLAPFAPPTIESNIRSEIMELSSSRFIFYIGGADPRKGLVALAKSLDSLLKKTKQLKVVFAGKEVVDDEIAETRKLKKTIHSLVCSDRFLFFGFISDAELAYLYKHAEAFVFPSKYEGFGLPILEAMQAGCPVIAYNNSSIPEVAGNAALLVKDGESLAPYIEKLINDPSLRREMIQKGKKQVKKFTWEKTARETLKILHEVGRSM